MVKEKSRIAAFTSQRRKRTIRFAVAGALAGAANGFFGAGGGLFLVPLFIGWLGMEHRKAFATSMAVILPLCLVSWLIYLIKGSMNFSLALPYLIGGAIGGLLAGRIFQKLPVLWLRRVLGLFILYGGIRALLLL